MSVPELKRQEGELKVITKARAFAARTIAVCTNEDKIPKKLRWAYAYKICEKSNEMFSNILEANSIFVENSTEAQMRIILWKKALANSASVLGFIDMSLDLPNVNIPIEKIKGWAEQVDEVQKLIRSRIKSDKARFSRVSSV